MNYAARVSRIAVFGGGIFLKHGKYYPAKLQIFVYICQLRAEKVFRFCGNFSSKMVTFSARNTKIYTKLGNFAGLCFSYFTKFHHQT